MAAGEFRIAEVVRNSLSLGILMSVKGGSVLVMHISTTNKALTKAFLFNTRLWLVCLVGCGNMAGMVSKLWGES